jgi:hypothetical protein
MKYKRDEIKDTSSQILAHLIYEPGGQDTLENITDWCMLHHARKQDFARIKKISALIAKMGTRN